MKSLYKKKINHYHWRNSICRYHTNFREKKNMLLKLIFTVETTVLTFEMKSRPCWSLKRFYHWFQQYVDSSCVQLCSPLRTVKYDHKIWMINYSQHRVLWRTPICILLTDTSQQVWRMGSEKEYQDSKWLWEHFWIFIVKTGLFSFH